MQLVLRDLRLDRNGWIFQADGRFSVGIHLVTGRIGSGKSTLAWILGGALNPDSGTIHREEIRSSLLSMQFPEYHITAPTVSGEIKSWDLSPEEILKEASLSGIEDRHISTLSRGQLKRLHLACLLNTRRDLIILDEPYASLDDQARRWFTERLDRLRDRICIIITHDLSCLPEVDELWEMVNGRLVSHGPFPEAWRRWISPPPLVRDILRQGVPENISRRSLEAVCGIRE